MARGSGPLNRRTSKYSPLQSSAMKLVRWVIFIADSLIIFMRSNHPVGDYFMICIGPYYFPQPRRMFEAYYAFRPPLLGF